MSSSTPQFNGGPLHGTTKHDTLPYAGRYLELAGDNTGRYERRNHQPKHPQGVDLRLEARMTHDTLLTVLIILAILCALLYIIRR